MSPRPRPHHLLPLMALLMAGTLLGCQTTPQHPRPQKVLLSFWTLQMGAYKDILQPMLTAFERQHPHVQIHWVDLPFQEADKKLITNLLSARPADVLNLNTDLTVQLMARRALLPPPPDTLGDLPPAIRDAVSLQGTPMGYPWYLTSQVTFLNRPLLAQFSARGQLPTTADALASLHRPKTVHNAYLMMPPLSDGGFFLKWLWRLGENPLQPQADGRTRLVLNTPVARQQLALWASLIQRRILPAETIATSRQGAGSLFLQEKLAVMAAGSSFFSSIQANNAALLPNLGLSPQWILHTQPTPPRRGDFARVDFATMLLAVPARSPHRREALQLAAFLTNATQQQRLCNQLPVLPAHQSLLAPLASGRWRPPGLTHPLALHATQLGAQQLLNAPTAFPNHPQFAPLARLVDTTVQQAILTPSAIPQLLKRAEAQGNALLLK